jgi:hypothetical protein
MPIATPIPQPYFTLSAADGGTVPISLKMSKRDHTICRNTALLIAALLFGAMPGHAWARGRSFPIEVTGSIIGVDRGKTEFTIQVDEPARILTIAVGRDCKFIRHGVPAQDDILKRGARVRVKYFSTIFTGKIAVQIESNPRPLIKSGIIEKIEPADRKLTLRVPGCQQRLILLWARNARCSKHGKTVSPTDLRENTTVRVNYYAPAFESNYAVEIEV